MEVNNYGRIFLFISFDVCIPNCRAINIQVIPASFFLEPSGSLLGVRGLQNTFVFTAQNINNCTQAHKGL
jgi:hypothetical protein